MNILTDPPKHNFIPFSKADSETKPTLKPSTIAMIQASDKVELYSKPKYTKAQQDTILIYDNLWKELGFDENIKPKLSFEPIIEEKKLMAFSPNYYEIFVLMTQCV